MKLEKAINPLLDDDELVGFSYILEQVVDKMKRIESVSHSLFFVVVPLQT